MPDESRFSESDFREVVKMRLARIGSLRQAAKEWGLSPSYLSDFLNGRRGPGKAILTAIGYEKVVKVEYRKV